MLRVGGAGVFDVCDIVRHLWRAFDCRGGYSGAPLHRVVVDECQDLTQAEIALVLRLADDKNGLFLCGDTAQAISRGGAAHDDAARLGQALRRVQGERRVALGRAARDGERDDEETLGVERSTAMVEISRSSKNLTYRVTGTY